MKIVPLASIVADARPGFASGKSDDNGVIQVRMNNVSTDGRLAFSTIRRVPRADADLLRFAVQPGDILFNATNSPELVGKSALFSGYSEAVVYSNHFLRLRLDPQQAVPGYLSRWLHAERAKGTFTAMCKQWVNQAAVPTERLMQMLVPLPPLEQQRRIAAILDEADGLRTMRRAALAQLDEMAQAIFVEMFGDPESNPKCWPISQLHEIVRLGDNINYGVVQPGDQVDGGVPLVRVGDLSEGRVDRTNIKTIAPEIEADYRRSRLRGDEVLVSCVGSIGVVALACADDKGSNIARAVARIPVGNLANRVFLANYLRSNFVQNYFTRELRTVSQPTLNIKQIAETPVLLPPLPLQSEFAERWATLQHLVADWSTRGAMLDSLFASLQHRAFRGEL